MVYPAYFPIYLSLEGRNCLVVGGGAIAEEKALALLSAGGKVTVVSPGLTDRLKALARSGEIGWEEREFLEKDATEAFVSIGATNDREVNRRVSKAAIAANRLGNSVDDPDACNFIMASVAKSGPVQVAVSTAGCSPALGQRLRDRIASEMLGEEVGRLAEFLGSKRSLVKERLEGYRLRQKFWEAVLDSTVPGLLAAGDVEGAENALGEMVKEFAGNGE